MLGVLIAVAAAEGSAALKIEDPATSTFAPARLMH